MTSPRRHVWRWGGGGGVRGGLRLPPPPPTPPSLGVTPSVGEGKGGIPPFPTLPPPPLNVVTATAAREKHSPRCHGNPPKNPRGDPFSTRGIFPPPKNHHRIPKISPPTRDAPQKQHDLSDPSPRRWTPPKTPQSHSGLPETPRNSPLEPPNFTPTRETPPRYGWGRLRRGGRAGGPVEQRQRRRPRSGRTRVRDPLGEGSDTRARQPRHWGWRVPMRIPHTLNSHCLPSQCPRELLVPAPLVCSHYPQ